MVIDQLDELHTKSVCFLRGEFDMHLAGLRTTTNAVVPVLPSFKTVGIEKYEEYHAQVP